MSEDYFEKDIRLLGNLLGDTIREQEGEKIFELIEKVRRLSVSYRRHEDVAAGKALDKILKSLSPDEAVVVIRAFTFFLHFINIAESKKSPILSVRKTIYLFIIYATNIFFYL